MKRTAPDTTGPEPAPAPAGNPAVNGARPARPRGNPAAGTPAPQPPAPAADAAADAATEPAAPAVPGGPADAPQQGSAPPGPPFVQAPTPAAEPDGPPTPPPPAPPSVVMMWLSQAAALGGEPTSVTVTAPVHEARIHVPDAPTFRAWCAHLRLAEAQRMVYDRLGQVAEATAWAQGWAVIVTLFGAAAVEQLRVPAPADQAGEPQ